MLYHAHEKYTAQLKYSKNNQIILKAHKDHVIINLVPRRRTHINNLYTTSHK